MRIRARHYATGQPIDVEYADGTVCCVSTAGTARADRQGGWLARALRRLHSNGGPGSSFDSPNLTGEQVRTAVDECRRHGIGGLLPPLVTGSFDQLAHGLSTLRRASETDPVVGAAVPGFHLEGPYIAPDDGPR